jgi:hypothetical protein
MIKTPSTHAPDRTEDSRAAPSAQNIPVQDISVQDIPIQVSQDLRCAKCQVNGAATWETPAPAIRARNRLRRLVGLTAGFKSVDSGGREGLTIACAGCGARIASS